MDELKGLFTIFIAVFESKLQEDTSKKRPISFAIKIDVLNIISAPKHGHMSVIWQWWELRINKILYNL